MRFLGFIGTISALGGAGLVFYRIEGFFKEQLLPYPSLPFQILGAGVVFCAVKAAFALGDWLQILYQSRSKKRSEAKRH